MTERQKNGNKMKESLWVHLGINIQKEYLISENMKDKIMLLKLYKIIWLKFKEQDKFHERFKW